MTSAENELKSLGIRSAGGLTLTEVAACLAVGAVLAGVAAAALEQAGGASQRQVCLNNLRIISAASADYAEQDADHNAIPIHPRYPVALPTVVGDYQYGGKSGHVEYAGDRKYTYEGGFGFYGRPLNRLLYDVDNMVPPECRGSAYPQECIQRDRNYDVPIYRCPSDFGYTGLHFVRYRNSHRTSFDYFGTSYVANVLIMCGGAAGNPLSSNSPFLRSLERVPNPARTIHYLENCGRWAWAWGYGVWPYGSEFTVGGWHGQDWWFNVVFTDGHADYLKIKGQGERIVASAEDVEYIPGLPGGVSAWWQVIIRGPGWQLDCLPSPPVRTGFSCDRPLADGADDAGARLAAGDTELSE